jgi:hypothetical protein
MNTSVNMLNNLPQNNSHVSVYSRTNIDALGSMIGVYNLSFNNSIMLYPKFVGDAYLNIFTSTGINMIKGQVNSLGFRMLSRILSSSFDYYNNTTKTTLSITSVDGSNLNIYVGANNSSGTAANFDTRENAFTSIGDGLTDTQATDLYTAVQIFQTTLNRNVGAQIVSDADAQAYINRVYTAGGTLTNTEANAVNQLTIDMKAANVWTAMKAIYPMIGSSAASCAQNLKSSSFTGTFTSGWTFASTGVTPNGTSAYMDTGLNDLSSMSNSSNSLGFYSRTNNSLTNCNDIGGYDGVYFTGLRFNNNNTNSFAHNGTDGQSGSLAIFNSTLSSAAFLTQSRTSLTSLKFIRNGVVLASTTSTKTGINVNRVFYVGATNGLSGAQQYSNREFAFAYFSDGLTDSEALNLYTAVQTFNTTLNRNV